LSLVKEKASQFVMLLGLVDSKKFGLMNENVFLNISERLKLKIKSEYV
jgi:hypothetical protein